MSGYMAAKNWLKIDTSVLEGDVWGEKFSKVEAYIYLVKTARWQKNETEKNGIIFGTGQLVTSYRELADIWGWKRSSVERFCKSLIERKIIEIESDKKSKTYSCVTIVNMKCETTIEHKWDTSGTPNGTPNGTQKPSCTTDLRGVDGTPNGTPFGTQAGHHSRAQVVTESDLFNNNLDNLDKNKVEVESPYNPPREKPKGYENFDFSFADDQFYGVLVKWLDYKRDGRKPKFIYANQKTLEDCYHSLVSTSRNIPEAAMEIVQYSIAGNYQGLFAPRGFWYEWEQRKKNEAYNTPPVQQNEQPCSPKSPERPFVYGMYFNTQTEADAFCDEQERIRKDYFEGRLKASSDMVDEHLRMGYAVKVVDCVIYDYE